MPEAFPIDVYREDLTRIASGIFETMLALDIQPVEQTWEPAPGRMTAAVYLAGAWQGAVLLECDKALACQLTGRLLSINTPATVDDDVRDALGELANMLGGNLKSVMPPGVALSMPSVVEGSDYSLRVCGGNAVVERAAYVSRAGVFWITLVELRDD